MYAKRLIDNYLFDWKNSPFRKPLILRGAQQVGKTSAIRHLAEGFDDFLEINFEENPKFKEVFESDLTPARTMEQLSVTIQPLLALDIRDWP